MFAVYVSYELVETIFGGRIHLQKVYWVCQGHVYLTEFASLLSILSFSMHKLHA